LGGKIKNFFWGGGGPELPKESSQPLSACIETSNGEYFIILNLNSCSGTFDLLTQAALKYSLSWLINIQY